MKIHYILTDISQYPGILKKVKYQLSALRSNDLRFELIIFTNKYSYKNYIKIINNEYLNILEIPKIYNNSFFALFKRIKRAFLISRLLNDEIKNYSSHDIIYMRYPYIFLYYPRKMFSPNRLFKVVFEHNTKELEEFKLSSGYFSFSFLQEFFLGRFLRYQSDAIIGVTDEITHYQLKRCKNPKKPHITIGNGIDVASVPLRDIPPPVTSELHLLFVANVSRWHGIDRLLRGLAEYAGPVNVILHIAGEGAGLLNLKNLAKRLHLNGRVIFHGFTTGEALDNLFNSCHIAVGSLGIHRVGLSESSTLKVREYCARGIPWIIACKDPDFPDDFPYIYRIPANESPIIIGEIIKFAERMYSDRDHPQKMRAYAIEYLDWSVKMKKLKEFLEQLIVESPSES